MEQPSTRTPQRKVRRDTPVPRPAAPVGPGESSSVFRARRLPGRTRPLRPRRLDQLPPARLTGLGSGLLTALVMLAAGKLDAMTLDGSPAVYGVCFLLACAGCALWVRPAEVLTAPVSAPIAFAVGALPISSSSGGGLGARIMGLVTVLSLQAGWLYAGTLLAALIGLYRRVALIRLRRRERHQQRKRPSRPPRSPRCSPGQQERSRR
ncbi:DUF6542 domain-containing protein [Streptomyces sp. NPDC002536]